MLPRISNIFYSLRFFGLVDKVADKLSRVKFVRLLSYCYSCRLLYELIKFSSNQAFKRHQKEKGFLSICRNNLSVVTSTFSSYRCLLFTIYILVYCHFRCHYLKVMFPNYGWFSCSLKKESVSPLVCLGTFVLGAASAQSHRALSRLSLKECERNYAFYRINFLKEKIL